MFKKRSAFLLMLVFAIGMVLPTAALAADGDEVPAPTGSLNLITSPIPISLVTDPGKPVTTDLRIKQSNPGTERLKVSLMKFGAQGEEGQPALMEREPGDDHFDWVKFDRPVFNAPSNEWQTIKMTINVPKTAAFGYYYAAVFTRVGDDQKKGQNITALNGGTAILVLLEARVPGAKRQVTLEKFAAKHRVVEFLPSEFEVKFANTGNVHVVPYGNIFVTRGGREVDTLIVNVGKGNLLPNSKRTFLAEWLDGFPHIQRVEENGTTKTDKNGDAVKKLMWSNGGEGAKSPIPHFRIGPYKAKLFAVYDDGIRDVPIEAEVTFWVIPWRILLVVLLVLGVVGFGVYTLVRGGLRGAQRMRSGRRRR
jgi:hypothetical protein